MQFAAFTHSWISIR